MNKAGERPTDSERVPGCRKTRPEPKPMKNRQETPANQSETEGILMEERAKDTNR